ncbi:MAG: sterol desaturase family protein [Bacteriovoracaceae bacterium]|nr:sterol desaturase family protein [Bacteriovoracaceae bacterium]
MKKYFEFIIYPIFCLLPIAMMTKIMATNIDLYFIPGLFYISAMLIVIVLEKLSPWERLWTKSQGDLGLDIFHIFGNLSVSTIAFTLYTLAFSYRNELELPKLSMLSWIAQYFIGLFIFDFGLYFIHRISHTTKWLWFLHAIHHSSERIYFLNSQRRHLLHEVLEGTPGFVMLMILGVSPIVVLMIIYTVNIHLLFQHANISYKMGPFTNIFSVAETHRWHHQRDWKEVQGNYGAIFSLWDFLLGTCLPHKAEPSKSVGLDEPSDLYRMSYLKQHRWPFETMKTYKSILRMKD